MNAIDRRVADQRGWALDNEGWWCVGRTKYLDGTRIIFKDSYSPSTNLLQAYKLWEEARPEGRWLGVYQLDKNYYEVSSRSGDVTPRRTSTFTDLPRAITTAWLEAMEATCQK